MAFPWIVENSFSNTTTPFGWDSESDTGNKLDVPTYYELAQIPGLEVPFRGASCLRVDLRSGDTNDHTITAGAIDIANAATSWFRFYLYLSPTFTATADDTFNLLELQQTDATQECALGIRVTAATGIIDIGIGDGVAPTNFVNLSTGVWHCVEWKVKISTAGAGTQDLYLDGSGSVISLTSLTSNAVDKGVLGTQDTLATTTGVILIDTFVMDDARIYPITERWPNQQILTSTGHVFVGPGAIESAALLSTGSDNTCYLYDTDTATGNDASARVVELDNAAHSVATAEEECIKFKRGCYAVLAGTNPRAQVSICTEADGPAAYGSAGAIRRYGLARKARPNNV